MRKVLLAAMAFFSSFPLLAAVNEQAANAPVETVDMAYVVLFVVGFIVAIVVFFYYLWRNDRDSKKTDS